MFVKSDAYTLSTAGACFAALAIFVLGCLVVVGLIPAMAWLNPSGDENENHCQRWYVLLRLFRV